MFVSEKGHRECQLDGDHQQHSIKRDCCRNQRPSEQQRRYKTSFALKRQPTGFNRRLRREAGLSTFEKLESNWTRLHQVPKEEGFFGKFCRPIWYCMLLFLKLVRG